MSLLTSETENIAAEAGVKKIMFVQAILSLIAPETSGARIKVLQNNQGVNTLIENPLGSAGSKHVDVRFQGYGFLPALH